MNKLTNRFYEAQEMYNNSYFVFNNLNGLNEAGSPQSKITINGHLDDFTISTLYRNYEQVAHNLKVYPTITIYPRGTELNGGMGGFYNADNNHIDMVDHYYLIRILSHEMRHAFQYIYFPDLFFATEYRTVREYLNCDIERDARGYSLDYCIAREYWEEAEFIRGEEAEFELVIQNKLSPISIGLNESYFRLNPAVASSVPRDYHWEQEYTYYTNEEYSNSGNNRWSSIVFGFKALANLAIIIFIIMLILGYFD